MEYDPACQPMYEVPCDACRGYGGVDLGPDFDHDPDWCPACGGSGYDFVPAHPIGEAHA